jgi:hypothetical protein
MLPFSKSIEFQWRLREDSFNDLCDVPIIPKGKFIPFGIVTESDSVGVITLHCFDDPFEFIRAENFTRNDCQEGYQGSVVPYSKIYYSNKSPLEAQQLAYEDVNYLIEGQQNANDNGTCTAIETFYVLDGNGDIFTDGLGNRFISL